MFLKMLEKKYNATHEKLHSVNGKKRNFYGKLNNKKYLPA